MASRSAFNISRTHTREQLLLEIGEPVYRWHRKEENVN